MKNILIAVAMALTLVFVVTTTKSRAQRSALRGGMVSSKTHAIGERIQFPRNLVGVHKGIHFRGEDLNVFMLGHQVTVTGAADIYDLKHKDVYVWSLKILDGREPVLKKAKEKQQHHYMDRIIWLEDSQTDMVTKFFDTFELPSGIFHIQLRIYIIPSHLDLTKIRFENQTEYVEGYKTVVIN